MNSPRIYICSKAGEVAPTELECMNAATGSSGLGSERVDRLMLLQGGSFLTRETEHEIESP